MTQQVADKKALLIAFLVIFIDLLGFGLVIPILPYYAKTFGATGSTIGFLMMCYSGMQLLFSPFWGALSDRMGRRPVLLCCIAGMSVSMLMLSQANSLTMIFAARLLAGFFGANISAASAYIADVTPPEGRAKGMGLIGAAFGLGFLFGPALGGFFSKWGYNMAPLVAGGLSLFNFLFAFKFLREPQLSLEERASHRNRLNFGLIKVVLNKAQVIVPIVIFFLVTMGLAQIETTFALFVSAKFGLDAFHAGMILALMALMMVIIQGGGIGRLAPKFGEMKLVLFGIVVIAVSAFVCGEVDRLVWFVVAVAIYGIGYSVINPSLLSLVSKASSPQHKGATMGFYQSAGSLGRIIGPLIAGFTFDHFGLGYPFFTASGFFVVAFMIVLSTRQKIKAV